MGSTRLLLERLLPLAILGTAMVAVPIMIFSPTGLERLNSLRVERERVDDEILRLSQEIRQLRAQVRAIKQDPRAIERAARDELGLVRQTEVVVQFQPPR